MKLRIRTSKLIRDLLVVILLIITFNLSVMSRRNISDGYELTSSILDTLVNRVFISEVTEQIGTLNSNNTVRYEYETRYEKLQWRSLFTAEQYWRWLEVSARCAPKPKIFSFLRQITSLDLFLFIALYSTRDRQRVHFFHLYPTLGPVL